MVAHSTLKCLVIPVMIMDLIFGLTILYYCMKFLPFLLLLSVNIFFYLTAAIFGLVGIICRKKCAFIIFLIL